MSYRKIIKQLLPAPVRMLRFRLYYYAVVAWNFFFAEKEISDYKDVPIFINNFNRYTMLKDLVGCLEKRGYRNIYIIDNNDWKIVNEKREELKKMSEGFLSKALLR